MSTAPTPRPERPAIDIRTPNIARVYDYWLGGKDNFAADRFEAERLLEIYPRLAQLAKDNRMFLSRAASWIAAQGIQQFLDIGSGLPTEQNTHEIVRLAEPSARVVYADIDPVVVVHAQALLSGAGVEAIKADLADPAAIISHPVVRRQIRPDQPTGLILAMVMHFFDATDAENIIDTLTDWLAPGSYVLISVGSGDEKTGGTLAREYSAATLRNHSPEQVTRFFRGLDLVPPGLVDAGRWHPSLAVARPKEHLGGHVLAGVGVKAG
jgi:SAM-dependent methyltransferase